jgi:hypothetical protein
MTGQDGMGLLGWAGQTGCSPRLSAPVSGGRMGRAAPARLVGQGDRPAQGDRQGDRRGRLIQRTQSDGRGRAGRRGRATRAERAGRLARAGWTARTANQRREAFR